MTVAIGAVAREMRRVFMVTDRKIGNDRLAVDDAATKIRSVTSDGRWWCAYACENTTFLESVLRRIRGGVLSERRAFLLAEVTDAIGDAFGAEIEAIVTRGGYRGRAAKQVHTGVQFILAGFDADGELHIGTVDPWGYYASTNDHGFAVIGSAADVAWAGLKMSPDLRRNGGDPGLVVYRLCQAKFLAEAFESVGEATTVVTVEGDGTRTILQQDAIAHARRTWEEGRAWKPSQELTLSLAGGLIIDADGNIIVNEIWNEFNATMAGHYDVLRGLHASRIKGDVFDDEWRRVQSASDDIEKLSAQIRERLSEWERTQLRALGVENQIRWLNEKRAVLGEIQSNAWTRMTTRRA